MLNKHMKDIEHDSLFHDPFVDFTDMKYIQQVPTFGFSRYPQ